MKKKITALSAVLILIFSLAGCGTPEKEQPEEQIDYDIAMVTAAGMIMDGGCNQEAWEAITEFGAEEGISHKYYKAAEATERAYNDSISTAVSKGAEVIVADGYTFEDVVYNAQKEYKDVKFILIDAEPVEEDSGKVKVNGNTAVSIFASEQAGYLAGYSAVRDGKTSLGFMGDLKKTTITDYGYGFLQGAEAAAEEEGIEVKVRYHYCGSGSDRDTVLEMAKKWYDSGTEVIFACGRLVEKPVIEAAEMSDGKVIAAETDKSAMSDTVMTSAAKDIDDVIEDQLEKYRKDKFPGGEIHFYDASNEGVYLDMETSDFEVFTEDDYDDIYEKLENGSVKVKKCGGKDIPVKTFGSLKITVVK